MKRKLQSFYILKLNSEYLRDNKYNINLTLDEARRNGFVVSLGDSQVLRTLRKIKHQSFDQEVLNKLLQQKKKVKRLPDSKENRKWLKEINAQIDKILFVPEIVSIKIDNVKHYKKIIESLVINGVNYKRLLAGSGNLRRNTIFFCDERIEKELKKVLNNNRNENTKLVLAKYGAYLALSNSSCYEVHFPNFTVIPDYEIDKVFRVNWINDDDTIEEKDVQIKTNYFDGMGLISPKLSEEYGLELGLDYIPANFIIRANFIKGMVCTFDFHDFARVNNKRYITDAWGNQVDIYNIEMVLTTSQFKLWQSYNSLQDYVDSCFINDLSFGISRYSPKEDRDYVWSNYQFNQVLDLNDEQVESLCSETVRYFEGLTGGDENLMLLYLLGDMANSEPDEDWFEKIEDPITKGIILERSLINDPYIKNYLYHSLSKKVREAYLGKILLPGNFQTIIGDPYCFSEYMFGMEPRGLLQDGEVYSEYWNKKGIEQVSCCRAPLTHQSENYVNKVRNTREMQHWYSYLNTGIVYPAGGSWSIKHADADLDGDIVMTTSQKEFIEGSQGGYPIGYQKKNAEKIIVDESKLWESEVKSLNSRVGFFTNVSSSYHCLLNKFELGTIEHNEILSRLMRLRRIQGDEIDRQKGILVKPFPEHWTKWNKTPEGATKDEIKEIELNNRILLDKRPYFFKYLYSDYKTRYNNFTSVYDSHCDTLWGKDLDEIIELFDKNDDQEKAIDNYKKFSYFLDLPSVMNRICWFLENKVKILKSQIRQSDKFDYRVLLSGNPIDSNKLRRMNELYKEYISEDEAIYTNLNNSEAYYQTKDQFIKFIQGKAFSISSDESELADLAISVVYRLHPNADKDFAWRCFKNGIVLNLVQKNNVEKVLIPLKDDTGNIEYLFSKYKLQELSIKRGEDKFD